MQHLKLRYMLSTTRTTTRRCGRNSNLSLYSSTIKPLSSTSSPSSSSLHYQQWSGLKSWRESPLNENRTWGPTGPIPSPEPSIEADDGLLAAASSLAEMGAAILSTSNPLAKSKLSHWAYSRWRRHNLPVGVAEPPSRPARPSKPQLVSPKEVPAPKISGLPLNAYMLHNLAHVELNAIDLAWDTVVRFSPYIEILGEGFYADFAHVADDESRHFAWCSQRLSELGFRYGDMPAHNLLWRECEKSSDNVSARLAVIPLVQVLSRRLEDLMQDHDWCKNWSVLGIVGLQALWRESLMRRLHMWLLVSTGLSTHVGKWAVSLALLSKIY